MLKAANTLILIFVILFFFTGVGKGIDAIELNQLIENAKVMDGKTVIVKGEAIGEVLERGNDAWVNINDGTNAMGIWLKLENTKKIMYFGDYKHKGDRVKVIGVFNRACVEHGGDMDIHCSTIEIIEEGYLIKEKVAFLKIIIGIILVSVTLIVADFYLIIMRKPTSGSILK